MESIPPTRAARDRRRFLSMLQLLELDGCRKLGGEADLRER
jgi:hypothetical protein